MLIVGMGKNCVNFVGFQVNVDIILGIVDVFDDDVYSDLITKPSFQAYNGGASVDELFGEPFERNVPAFRDFARFDEGPGLFWLLIDVEN